MSPWTDEVKAELIADYLASEPTAESNSEILATLAENYSHSPNAIRIMLTQEQVFVKREQVAASAEGTTATKRVSKDAAISRLKEVITAKGKPLDDTVLDKLTGKAAIYLASILE